MTNTTNQSPGTSEQPEQPRPARGPGRPWIGPQRKVSLPDDVWAEVQREARATGRSASAVIRDALAVRYGIGGQR